MKDTITTVKYTGNAITVVTLSGKAYLIEVSAQPSGNIGLDTPEYFRDLLSWSTDFGNFKLKSTISCGEMIARSEKKPSPRIQNTWTLCALTDDWRLIMGGSYGYVGVWNHKIDKFLYKMQGENDYSEDAVPKAITSIAFNESNVIGANMGGSILVWGLDFQ